MSHHCEQFMATITHRCKRAGFLFLAVLGGAQAHAAGAPTADLAKFFGWDDPRIIVVDRNTGPAHAADFNGDGLTDLAIVNNAKSRIELHLQRQSPRTDQDITRDYKVNELPPSPFYDRVEVSVAHRVMGFRPLDADGDGKLDIIYSGIPAEVVVLRQTEGNRFKAHSKRRIKNLSASHDGLEIADVTGTVAPELLAVVDGKIEIYNLESGEVLGEPTTLGTGGGGEEIVAFFVEDYNGDGLMDVMAAIPDAPAPVRLWLQDPLAQPGSSGQVKLGQLGPELRFEMPGLRELEPIRLPNRAAASVAIIERASRRIVLADLNMTATSAMDSSAAAPANAGETDASAEVHNFSGPGNKTRSSVVADVDGDGRLDLLATDQAANSLVLYRQSAGVGLTGETRFSALKDPRAVAVGQWDDDAPLEVFVLSEADKVVGISQYDTASQRIDFPQPVALITAGASPAAMAHASLPSGPVLAVVARDKRDHTLEIHRPGKDAVALKLEGVSRPPQSMLAGDFDHDSKSDLLLFTPGEPLVMVRSIDGPSLEMQVLTDKAMPQFGLVQAAGPDNTALFDIDADGHAELLLSDQNFVRACAFSVEKGWRVVEQVTLPESSASLVGLTVLGEGNGARIIAADKANKRLVLMSRDDKAGWQVRGRMRFEGFEVSGIHAGAFSGDDEPSVLALSPAAFAVIRLEGTRYSLDEFAAFRSDAEDRLEHEIEAGDLNGDGFTDIVCLDAREQMCQAFTITAARRMLLATEFKVFESRQFGRGEEREFEPSAAIISDLTGDGRDDLTLQVHDRYIIFPQMTGRKN